VLLAAGAFSTSVPLGLIVTVVAGAWWFAVGRLRPGAGVVPAFAPLAGVLRASPALPLLSGFFLHGVWPAAAAGAMSGLVLVVTSLAGRSSSLVDVAWPILVAPLAAPGPVAAVTAATLLRAAVLIVGWAVAAALSALGARRGTRGGALAGMLAGLAVTAVSLGPWVTGTSQMPLPTLLQLGAASILVIVVVALGPPVASETDDDAKEA
jgi:hypothetical protein